MEQYEIKQNLEVEDFIGDEGIPSLYWTWSNIIDNYGVDLVNIFEDIDLSNTSFYNRESEFSWWPKSKLARIRKEFIDHQSTWPGTVGPIHPSEFRKGELETLQYLWPIRQDPKKIFALLICCSLFPRMKSYRAQYLHENWPAYYCVNELYIMANKYIFNKSHQDAWHGSCTKVLPVSNSDYYYNIDSISAIIKYLAEEHAQLLCKYQPVRLVF